METDLSDLYYLQLKEGCISLKCNHPFCKSSSDFIFTDESDDSLRAKANEMARNHENENNLCPNFPRTLYDFSIFEKVIDFNDFIDTFAKNQKIKNQQQISKIVSNITCFPFLFSHDLNEIDFQTIHPPQELIRDFIQAEKRNSTSLNFLSADYNKCVNRIISNSNQSQIYFNSLSHIRAIFISFLFFNLLDSNEKLLFNLINHVMSLTEKAHSLLVDMFSKSPLFINELNTVVQKALSHHVESKPFKIDEIVWNASKFVHFILCAANDKSGKNISYQTFANPAITKKFSTKSEIRRFVSLNPSLLYTPSVVNVIKKARIIPDGCIFSSSSHLVFPTVTSTFTLKDFADHKELHPVPKLSESSNNHHRRRRRRHSDHDVDDEDNDDDGSHSEGSNSSGNDSDDDNSGLDSLLDLIENVLLRELRTRYLNDDDDDETPSHRGVAPSYDDIGKEEFKNLQYSVNVKRRAQARLSFEVHRNNLLDDTLRALLTTDQADLFGKLKVSFIGEDAIDVGGVTREFFTLVTDLIFSPDYGMFELINNKVYWFRREDNLEMVRYFTLLGAFIGIAINNKVILPIRFPDILYKKLLNTKNCKFDLYDLSEIDQQMAQSLRALLEMKENGDDVADADLMYEVSVDYFGAVQIIELVENGSNILVTNDNLEDYIEKYIDWKLNKSIEKQYKAFEEGYNLICNTPAMKVFHPSEISELVSGIETLDWVAFKESAVLKGYRKESQTIKDLWYILDNEWDEKKRITFLYFITGSKTAPVGGLGNLCVTINKTSDTNLLPIAHTCFSKIDLPDYCNRKKLRRNLEICLENCEGFGLK